MTHHSWQNCSIWCNCIILSLLHLITSLQASKMRSKPKGSITLKWAVPIHKLSLFNPFFILQNPRSLDKQAATNLFGKNQQFDPVSAFVLNLSSSIVKGIKMIMIIIIKEQMKKDIIKNFRKQPAHFVKVSQRKQNNWFW